MVTLHYTSKSRHVFKISWRCASQTCGDAVFNQYLIQNSVFSTLSTTSHIHIALFSMPLKWLSHPQLDAEVEN